MAAFIAGDTPIETFEYGLPESADSATSVALSVAGQTIPASIESAGVVSGSWSALDLPTVGIHAVYAVTSAEGRSQRFLVDWLVIDDPSQAWHNVTSARDALGDGGPSDDGDLYRLLEVARDQVEAFAPVLAAGAAVPERYRAAQLMQARAVQNAYVSNGDQQTDLGGGLIVSVRPLDWNVKQLLRPKSATKVAR